MLPMERLYLKGLVVQNVRTLLSTQHSPQALLSLSWPDDEEGESLCSPVYIEDREGRVHQGVRWLLAQSPDLCSSSSVGEGLQSLPPQKPNCVWSQALGVSYCTKELNIFQNTVLMMKSQWGTLEGVHRRGFRVSILALPHELTETLECIWRKKPQET